MINRINQDFTAKTEIRDRTLKRSRELIRYCANSIRATHRDDDEEATKLLRSAQSIAAEMVSEARQLPDIYFAGYTQDALKEYSEAHLTRALILGEALPAPQALDVENAAYINGLAETVGELRRYALDALRRGEVATSEKMLDMMDEIYTGLLTVDFPSAITRGLRRNTDIARSILERTRGDVTTAVRQEEMKQALEAFEAQVKGA
ncbi:MAG TPA: haloacid dehalogenase [Chloroflexi bacterium]|nr:haloacid dehalogenase [Chloroflexota bacterium]